MMIVAMTKIIKIVIIMTLYLIGKVEFVYAFPTPFAKGWKVFVNVFNPSIWVGVTKF